ncbi:MAG: hypothetical protein IJE60_05495, partial [Tyzzerella sp.]|nr:hypothetical protein [Tyzzerella sp.]
MKRKRMIGISLVIGLLLIGLIVALAINYSRSQPVVEQKEFTELKVSATATAEAGTEYLFETPSVKYGDEELDVTVTVQYGNKLIPHDGKKYYIEETGEYTITYAAYADGKSTAATTKLTAVDGVGPVIVSKLSQYIRCNTNIDLTESFVPKDISGGKIDSYSVVDITNGKEKNLKSGQFDGKNYTLRITDGRVKSVRVKISASDSVGITNTRDVDVKVISNKYGVYTMESKDVYKTVSASIYGESVDVLEKKEGGYAVFKATVPKQYPKFMIQSEELKDLANFDYITVRYKVSYSSSSGNVGIKGIKGDVYNKPSSLVTDNGWTVATWRKDEAYNDIGKNVFDYIKEHGIFELSINAWASADAVTTITLAEISGGYDDIISDGRTAVNLTNKLNLTEKEFTAAFTPEGGVKQTVGNINAFAPKTAGKLTIHVNKEGYLPGELILNVLSAPVYGVYKMEHKAMYNTVSATSGSEGFGVKEITDGDTKALQATFTGTYLKYTFSADYLKDLANFDYITLKYKITYSENTGSVGLKGTAGDVYNRATAVTTEDGWTIATWRKDDTHNNIGEDVFSYIKEKGIIEISVYAWNGKDTKTTITVAEVTGGYDGLVSDGGKTTYNLVDKIGLPVNEYSATFTPEGGKEINIGNRKAFTPYTAGQITVKVNKQGYCLSQFVIDVREAFKYGTYVTASKDDFKAVSTSIYGAPIEVKEVTENGTPALQAVMKKEWPKFCIQSEQLKDLSKFDYFTIKYKLSGDVASLGLQGMQGSVYNRAVDTVTDDDGWTYATWRKDNQKAINNSISDPQGADVFDYIEKNGSIEICLYVGA